jgi:hypothetical protein
LRSKGRNSPCLLGGKKIKLGDKLLHFSPIRLSTGKNMYADFDNQKNVQILNSAAHKLIRLSGENVDG